MKFKNKTIEELETMSFDDLAYEILKEKGKKIWSTNSRFLHTTCYRKKIYSTWKRILGFKRKSYC